MLKERSDINWDLLAKYLAGEADHEEEAQLSRWLDRSETNRTYLTGLEQWWQQTGQLVMYSKIDTVADWQKVKQRLKLHEPTRRMLAPRRNIFERYSFSRSIAAVFVVLMLVGAAYYGFTGLRERRTQQQEAVFNQINVPAGQRSQMVLADGTSVWINSGSTLQFPANFESNLRLVKLEGEAYFEVAVDKQKPFVVQTLGLEIKVYGTSFNVMSFANDTVDEVVLHSGSVSVTGLDSGNEIILQPNQKIVYARGEHIFAGPIPVDRDDVSVWREGKLVFNDEPFGEIAKKLERRYGVTINITDKSICQQHYRGVFRRESLEQAIKAIQLTAKYKYKIEDDVVTIYK